MCVIGKKRKKVEEYIMSRRIIFNMAMSIDGYIADDNGGYDWIVGDGDDTNNTDKKFEYTEFLDTIDTLVMGYNSYRDVNLDDFKGKKIIVATSKENLSDDCVSFINSDICGFIESLKASGGKDIWLFGGGVLIDAFIKRDMIDTYIIGIIPVILGKGRKLFYDDNPKINLHMDECTTQQGIAIFRYTKRK